MSTFPRTLASLLTLLAAALLLAGCGGSDDSSSDDSGGGSKDSGGETTGGGDGEAKSVFTDACGGCHTLADAGTSGAVGPNLDEAKPDADRVKEMIDNGGGAMPAGLLEGEERDAVAEYVAGAAGG